MTSADWSDVASFLWVIALFCLWPFLVIGSLNVLGADIPMTFKTWLAVTVLVMSVKASKGRRAST